MLSPLRLGHVGQGSLDFQAFSLPRYIAPVTFDPPERKGAGAGAGAGEG